jgi:hypothetical protein
MFDWADFFDNRAQCKMGREQIENLNLLYVSATQAKPNLNANEELIEMIKEYQAKKAQLVADANATLFLTGRLPAFLYALAER